MRLENISDMYRYKKCSYTALLLVVAVALTLYIQCDRFPNLYISVNEIGLNKMVTKVNSNSANTSELRQFYHQREKVYAYRRFLVKRQCRALGDKGSYGSPEKGPLNRLRWHMQSKLVMCFNAKVGTSTWSRYLMDTAFPGLLQNSSRNKHAEAYINLQPPKRLNRSQTVSLLQSFSKVMVVRDPFARIVSAYRDKIFNTTTILTDDILARVRNKMKSNSTLPYPTFKEFIWTIIATTPLESVNNGDLDVLTKRSNRHWLQYYVNCAPCDIHYDVIAKMETIHEDTRYILSKYNLGVPETVWAHSNEGSSSEDIAVGMFKEIPRRLKQELYKRYRPDFLMFGYSVKKYLDIKPKVIRQYNPFLVKE